MGLHFHDRQLIVYDANNNVFVASNSQELSSHANWFKTSPAQEQLIALSRSSSRDRVFATFDSGEHAIRAVAFEFLPKNKHYFSGGQFCTKAELIQTRRAFYVAVQLPC
jgi:hypothetical protein